ncbi:nitroreductase family protein [Litoribrevibacter albus]|uniref:Putative NAD(P)H nitroreductase n=1 Tax=Litoribrevibacter albus TaxID=1473156 RepID=A0AA37SBJ2_9GAMM|nr:nitroreductase family protein [Litoribrevibacter albus]GLQ32296.1 nitroreductase [Litoribrevibacter albus]
MEALELLTSRVSIPKLRAPAPSKDVMAQCYQAAMRAPDHGRLKPWRFIHIEGDGLDRLGQLYLDAENFDSVKDAGIEVSEVRQQKLLSMPKRAPLIVIVVAKVEQHPKVPREEQLMAAACAAYGLSVAVYDQGFGCMWRTGELAYHPLVKTGLELEENEEIVGYLYIGTPDCRPKTPKPEDLSQFVKTF